MMSPCKDCTKRCVACHDNCTEYQAYRLERINMNVWLAKENYNHARQGCWSSTVSTRYAREKATRKGNTMLRLR